MAGKPVGFNADDESLHILEQMKLAAQNKSGVIRALLRMFKKCNLSLDRMEAALNAGLPPSTLPAPSPLEIQNTEEEDDHE